MHELFCKRITNHYAGLDSFGIFVLRIPFIRHIANADIRCITGITFGKILVPISGLAVPQDTKPWI